MGDKGFYDYRFDIILRWFSEKRRMIFPNSPSYKDIKTFSDEEKCIALNMFCKELSLKKWDVFKYLYDLEEEYSDLPRITYTIFQFLNLTVEDFPQHYTTYVESMWRKNEINDITRNRCIGIFLLSLVGGRYNEDENRYGHNVSKGFDTQLFGESHKYIDIQVEHKTLELRGIHYMFYDYDIWFFGEFYKIISKMDKKHLSLEIFTSIPGVSILLPFMPYQLITISETTFDTSDPFVQDFLIHHPESVKYEEFKQLFTCEWNDLKVLATKKWIESHSEEIEPFYALIGLPEIEVKVMKLLFSGRNPTFYESDDDLCNTKNPSEGFILDENQIEYLILRRDPLSVNRSVSKLTKLKEIKFLPTETERSYYDRDPFYKEADFSVSDLQILPDHLEPYLRFYDLYDGISSISIFQSDKQIFNLPVYEGITENIYMADVGDLIQEYQFMIDEGHVVYLHLCLQNLEELQENEEAIQSLSHLKEIVVEFEEKVTSEQLPDWLKKLQKKINTEIYSHGDYL
jgi:hypothetical protein